MRKDIHPKYYNSVFECTTCENKIKIGSTLGENIKIDTCSSCHPFYSGNQKFANAAGRVEKFKSKFKQKEKIESQVTEISKKQIEINKEKLVSKPKKEKLATLDDLTKK
ncbi:50S ribosomal protein L31 [Spiroplasma endosymbiont of Amphibalanus improvisus]|uniref:50S ribosomal protein L31 n=1 Tax=Spiroplasma endosymbiont of Amphibalanus improvisus TaxID=3066327 RepID=UPI00313B1E03